MRVLVTGSTGQLGNCLKKIAGSYPHFKFFFYNSQELDITNRLDVKKVFTTVKPQYCINTAAYTNVEMAETEPEIAYLVNAKAVEYLAKECLLHETILVHISTDYVFDGEKKQPYVENDPVNPLNQYGKSKLAGEVLINTLLTSFYIIRTSWLYSEYGKNFYKTIAQKAKTENKLWVTNSQMGCPTNANNLAFFIMKVLETKPNYGTLHFCDGIAMTWFDFAVKIVNEIGLQNQVEVLVNNQLNTKAIRPAYSVLKNTNL
mgnify:CR=1 FL=1